MSNIRKDWDPKLCRSNSISKTVRTEPVPKPDITFRVKGTGAIHPENPVIIEFSDGSEQILTTAEATYLAFTILWQFSNKNVHGFHSSSRFGEVLDDMANHYGFRSLYETQ